MHHHQRSGQARVRIAGKDYYLGVYGSTEAKEAYARLLAELAATGQPPARQEEGQGTVAELVAQWLAYMPSRYHANSREPPQFRQALEVVVRLYGSQPARAFDSLALMAVQRAMASGSWLREEEQVRLRQKGRPVGWCRNVVNRQLVRVRTVWRWAESRKLVPPGTWSSLLTVEGVGRNAPGVRQTKPQSAASWDELRAVLRCCRPAPRAMLLLQWWAGMRSEEVRLMRREDIDTSGAVWLYRPAKHKCEWRGQERVVPLGRKCQSVLIPWMKKAGYLFEARSGQPYSAFSYAQSVRRAAARAGVQGFHPYRCRHAAKQRLTREHGLDAARAVLGQKSLGTTNLYASQQDLRTATDVAGKAC